MKVARKKSHLKRKPEGGDGLDDRKLYAQSRVDAVIEASISALAANRRRPGAR